MGIDGVEAMNRMFTENHKELPKRNINSLSSSAMPPIAKRQKPESPATTPTTQVDKMDIDSAGTWDAPSSQWKTANSGLGSHSRSSSDVTVVDHSIEGDSVFSPEDEPVSASGDHGQPKSFSISTPYSSEDIRTPGMPTLQTSINSNSGLDFPATYLSLTRKPSSQAEEYFKIFADTKIYEPHCVTIFQKILRYALQRIDEKGSPVIEEIKPHYKFGILQTGCFGEGYQDEIQWKPNIDLSILRVSKMFHEVGVVAFYGTECFLFNDPERCYWWLRQIKSNITKIRFLKLDLHSGYWRWDGSRAEMKKTLDRWYLARSQEDLWLTVFNFIKNRHHLRVLDVLFVEWDFWCIINEEIDMIKSERDYLLEAIARLRGIEHVRLTEEGGRYGDRYTRYRDLRERELVMMQTPTPRQKNPSLSLKGLIQTMKKSRSMMANARSNAVLTLTQQRDRQAHGQATRRVPHAARRKRIITYGGHASHSYYPKQGG